MEQKDRRHSVVEDEQWLKVPDDTGSRAQPVLTDETAPFWGALSDGQLLLQFCQECRLYQYFPVGGCSHCGSSSIAFKEVLPLGRLYTFSVCYLSFGPGLEPPYAVAYVELDVQKELRMVSNIVNCRISDLRIGMALRLRVTGGGTQALPLFEPI
jgi:uncharacterized OB-fold protein